MLTLDSKFSLKIDFEQIIDLISKLPLEYRLSLFQLLQKQLEADIPFSDNIRGSLDITQYRKIENANKNWDSIEGKWPGDETDEQIYKALEELS